MGCVSKISDLENPADLLDRKNYWSASVNTSWSRFVIEVCNENPILIKNIECYDLFNIEAYNVSNDSVKVENLLGIGKK